MYDHQKTIVYMKQDAHHFVHYTELQVQIIPSIKQGLKLLVFFKPLSSCPLTKQPTKILIADEHLENFFYSESLLKEWKLTSINEEELNLHFENLFKNDTEWPLMLIDQ